MPTSDEILQSMHASGGGPIYSGQSLDGLDLHGRVIDTPLNLSGARITGPVNLAEAELRGGLIANRTFFDGGLNTHRSVIEGDVQLSHARFGGPVDMSYTHVRGRVYAWRARFFAEATFRQLTVSPGTGIDKSFIWPGELNFSWAWFHGMAQFERCYLEGPVYFWRTRFLDACSFDETSFGLDATFMGMPSEVCLAREELGWDFFQRLQDLGLILYDDEEVSVVDGRNCPMFGTLADVKSIQELHQRMEALGLLPDERQALEKQFQRHIGPMFAKMASMQRLRIVQPRQVKFIAVNGQQWDLSGTDTNAIAFFNAEQQPVPVSVGLGRSYDRVFISYGGPDQAIAERFNHALQNVGVETFFYPEDSIPGRAIDEEMRDGIAGYDRILLLCSQSSPLRAGWRFELLRAMERENQQGKEAVLIPVAIDGGLWEPWPEDLEPVKQRLLGRTVADFRGALEDPVRFNDQLARVLITLRKEETES